MGTFSFVHDHKDTFFHLIIRRHLFGCSSILDVGCGENSSIGTDIKNLYSEGIEISRKSIAISRKNRIHNKYIQGDITKINSYYRPKSFDIVAAIDVIEHLSRRDGLGFISDLEQIARKKVIIMTPNGFCRQDHYKENPYQDHRSGWTVNDFRDRGYKVYGLRSFKWLRGAFATIRYKPWFFWGLIAFITEPILYFFPISSFDVLAVKNIQK